MPILPTPKAIAALCRTKLAETIAIEVVAQTGSTNADLLARFDGSAGQPALTGPTLRIALAQTAGRGRAGRVWQSDHAGLTFSLAWRFRCEVTALTGLPLAVGVMIAAVLEQNEQSVRLKWPNDLLLNDRKVGGILIETVSGPSLLHHETWAVIGIAINLKNMTHSSADAANAASSWSGLEPNQSPLSAVLHPAAVAMPVAAAYLPMVDRTALIAALLDQLLPGLQVFADSGLEPFISRWNALHAYAGKSVAIFDHQQRIDSGRAVGIDGAGRLLLQTPRGQVAIAAGDVSLRLTEEVGDVAVD